MALYGITIDAVALVAATAKTVLELGTSASDRIRIVQWWCEFDGVTSTAVPVKVEFQRASGAVTTATTLTPEKFDPADGAAATVSKHTTTTEGAGTLSGGSIHRIHPQSGIIVQYPLGREPVIAVSSFWRLRCTAAAGVNATAGIFWEE